VATKKDFERMLTLCLLEKVFNDYRNFRPFTRTADYPAALVDFSQKGKKRISRLPALVNNPKTKQKIALKRSRTQM